MLSACSLLYSLSKAAGMRTSFYQSMYAPEVYQLDFQFYAVEAIPHLIIRGAVSECL